MVNNISMWKYFDDRTLFLPCRVKYVSIIWRENIGKPVGNWTASFTGKFVCITPLLFDWIVWHPTPFIFPFRASSVYWCIIIYYDVMIHNLWRYRIIYFLSKWTEPCFKTLCSTKWIITSFEHLLGKTVLRQLSFLANNFRYRNDPSIATNPRTFPVITRCFFHFELRQPWQWTSRSHRSKTCGRFLFQPIIKRHITWSCFICKRLC